MASTFSIFKTGVKIEGIAPKELKEMEEHYVMGLPKSLSVTAHELSVESGLPYKKWALFLDHPATQLFMQQQLTDIDQANARKARIQLGDAANATDIGVVKMYEQLKKSGATDRRKEIKVYFLPSDVMKLKAAIVNFIENAAPYIAEMDDPEKMNALIEELKTRAEITSV